MDKIKTYVAVVILAIVLSAGCVTAAKRAYRDYTATPTPTTAPPTPKPTPTPVPTPVAIVTASNEELLELFGGYSEGGWLSWHHANASGLKDMTVHVTVYGHRFETVYHWWSVSWAQYFVEAPKVGNKFLFVYVNMWMEDQSDPRMWGMEEDHFRVQVGQNLYAPDTGYAKELRIKELEEVFDYQNKERIMPYGYLRVQPAGREEAIQSYYLRAGRSNAWDGFILFQVPIETKAEDTKVLGRFDNLGGYAWWQLI